MHSGRQRGFLLELAAEGLLSQLPSLAQQLTDPKVRALDVLGPPVTERWLHWMQSQPRQYQINVIAELADVPTDRARQRARAILSELAPDLTEEARQPGYEFLSALPRSVQRFLVPDPFTGGMTLAANQSPIDPELLLCLLPVDAPPIWSQCQLHKSYQINDLISTVGHGPSYRATREEIPFLVELWLDRSIYPIVEKHEQSFHELAKVSQQREWSRRILRLVDFSIKPRPTFVYDHQPGGDLARLLSTMQQQTSRGFAPDEVLRLILQLVEGLALIHESGHIYGCLKPTSVRVSGEELRLAHFGLGMVEQEHARIRGPIQEQLSPAEHVLCRSASDQRRYVSPEIFQGGEPLPSDDLYALGVLWSQLLLGDIATSISLDDLKSVQAPDQVSIIQACLGPRDQRPRHAGDLLSLLQMSGVAQPTTTRTESSILTADDIREMRASQKRLLGQARELLDAHEDLHEVTQDCQRRTLRWLLIGSLATLGMLVAFLWMELAGVAWLLLLLPILTVVLISRHGRSQIRAAEVELERRISQLEIEYPDEMQGWGGASILRNRELVREMVGTLETDMGIINVP